MPEKVERNYKKKLAQCGKNVNCAKPKVNA